LSPPAKAWNVEAAVQRITASASSDGGYQAQLVELADSHAGIYRRPSTICTTSSVRRSAKSRRRPT
jgi:hypothetical protein